MSQQSFFEKNKPLTLEQIIQITGCAVPDGVSLDSEIKGVAPLDTAGKTDIVYMDNPSYLEQLSETKAGFCLVSSRFALKVPSSTVVLLTKQPYHAFAKVIASFYPKAMRPETSFEMSGVSKHAFIDPTARIGNNVVIDPGVIIGAHADIGDGTLVGAHSVIGVHSQIGKNCSIAPHVTISHSIVGQNVIIHSGVRIGQDGFGFAMGATGHKKVPQIGRVFVHDDVEIGANTTVDRGASRDTIIGEGTKIDNQVQIGHNVIIGKHCVIVACVGIAGSTVLGDFVIVGGGAGIAGHLKVGSGAQIAAYSGLNADIPAGERWGGVPAKPLRVWAREIAALKNIASRPSKDG